MEIPKEKIDKLEQIIKARLEKLDQRRVTDQRKSRIISFFLMLASVVFLLIEGETISGDWAWAKLLVGGALLWFTSYALIYTLYFKRLHNKTYKKEIVPELIQTVIPGAQYSSKSPFREKELKENKLYKMKDKECEDAITGRIGKTDFMFSEVKISHQETDSDDRTEKVYDLIGFVFIADFNKHFSGHTVLSSKKSHLDIGWFTSYTKCVLEDLDFEKLYTTYTTDDQQSRYISLRDCSIASWN